MKKNAIIIAGPTATGKSALAVSLAKKLDGEIISADSMQIYRRMDIGSAKVTADEMQGVPHYMLDIKEPSEENFSVADYCALAKEKIEDILKRKKLPIIVGGTGLYISSLADNIEFAEGNTNLELRERLFAIAEEKGNAYVHAMLKEIDPETAESVHENNIKRIVRAIEVYNATGITLSEQNRRSKNTPSPYNFIMLALFLNREKMYERINLRVDKMFEQGLIDEVKALAAEGLTKQMQAMQGIGYKEVFDYMENSITKEECIELVKKNTRNYAKRQLTWFKRDKRYIWLDAQAQNVEDDAFYVIKNKLF